MHVRTPVPPLVGIPDRIAQIVLRALNKDPAHRQQTVEQLQNECQNAIVEMSAPGHMSGSLPVQQSQQPHQVRTVVSNQGMAPQQAGASNDPARTVIAMPPQPGLMPGQRQMPMPPQQVPAHTPITPHGGPPQARTMIDSHGVPPVGMRQSGQMAAKRKKKKQADALFWALCIIAGVLIGVIAYVLVAKVAH